MELSRTVNMDITNLFYGPRKKKEKKEKKKKKRKKEKKKEKMTKGQKARRRGRISIPLT